MMELFLKALVTLTGTTMTVWGAAAHNPTMVELGLVLIFITLGVIGQLERGRGETR